MLLPLFLYHEPKNLFQSIDKSHFSPRFKLKQRAHVTHLPKERVRRDRLILQFEVLVCDSNYYNSSWHGLPSVVGCFFLWDIRTELNPDKDYVNTFANDRDDYTNIPIRFSKYDVDLSPTELQARDNHNLKASSAIIDHNNLHLPPLRFLHLNQNAI
jgi:hypothetical protein